MIRAIQAIGILALAAACGVVSQCVRDWPQALPVAATGGVVQAFKDGVARTPEVRERTASPLVAQAETFALFLNPPAPAKEGASARERRASAPVPAPALRPVTATPKFRLIGTSCSEIRPERSMALVVESGSKEARWVREGEQLGHFAIHEIKPGAVVYLAGEGTSEMVLDREAGPTVVAAGSNLAGPAGSQAATNDTPMLPASRPLRLPRATRARTVGSARSAALDCLSERP